MFTASVEHGGTPYRLSWLEGGTVVGDRTAVSCLHATTAKHAQRLGPHAALLRDPACAYLLMSLAFGEVEIVDGELPPLRCLPAECC